MQDTLHELIHSLTKSEKRYFKVQVREGKEHKYLQLFELLAGMKAFDPDQVQKTMQWKDFRASYSMAKRYLYDKLLDSLASFSKNVSVAQRLPAEGAHIKVLVRKDLYAQAQRKIDKAKRLAYPAETLEQLLDILHEERNLLILGTGKPFTQAGLDKVLGELEFVIRGIALLHKVRAIHYRLYSLIRLSGGLKTKENWETLEQCKEELMALEVDKQPYLFPQIYYFNILNQYYYLNGKLEDSKKSLKNALEIFEQNPAFSRENQLGYMSVLHNLCNRGFVTRDYHLCLKMVLAFSNISGLYPDSVMKWRESYYGLGLALLFNSGFLSGSYSFIAKCMEIADASPPVIGKIFVHKSWLDLCYLHFIDGQYTKALARLQKLIQEPNQTGMRNFKRLSPLLEIVIHLELGSTDWLEYRVRALKKRTYSEKAFLFEKVFLEYVDDVLKAKTEEEKKDVAAKLKDEFALLRSNPEEVVIYSFFPFESWVDAKASGRTMKEILQADWKRNGGPDLVLD